MTGSDEGTAAPGTFSAELAAWLASGADRSLGDLGAVFAERTFAVAILLLMVPAALPLPTGGVTHVLEAMAVVVAGEMVLGLSTLWLPARWRQRPLGPAMTGRALPTVVRMVAFFERFSRKRGAAVLRRGWARRLVGVALVGLIVAAALAPPFSGLDTLPALGAVVVCLAVILEDAAVLAIGLLLGVVGAVLEVVLGVALVDFIRRLW